MAGPDVYAYVPSFPAMIPATCVPCREPGPHGVAVVSPGYAYTLPTMTLLLAYVAVLRFVRTPPETRCAFG